MNNVQIYQSDVNPRQLPHLIYEATKKWKGIWDSVGKKRCFLYTPLFPGKGAYRKSAFFKQLPLFYTMPTCIWGRLFFSKSPKGNWLPNSLMFSGNWMFSILFIILKISLFSSYTIVMKCLSSPEVMMFRG